MTFGSGAPPGELINLIFFVCKAKVSTPTIPKLTHSTAITYKSQTQMDGRSLSNFVMLQWLVVCKVFDILHNHRGLSECRTSSLVSSCISNISHGKDIRELGIVDLECPSYTHETSIIDGFW
jgi:hypothetical protein